MEQIIIPDVCSHEQSSTGDWEPQYPAFEKETIASTVTDDPDLDELPKNFHSMYISLGDGQSDSKARLSSCTFQFRFCFSFAFSLAVSIAEAESIRVVPGVAARAKKSRPSPRSFAFVRESESIEIRRSTEEKQ